LGLATKVGLEISEETSEWLDDISRFNINARYDNYKQDFYNLYTREFTRIWAARIEKLRLWLMKEL
jgi:hypothetical protein